MLPDAHVHFYVCVPPSSDQSVEPPPVVVVGWGSCCEGCSSMRRQHICVRITIHPVFTPPEHHHQQSLLCSEKFPGRYSGCNSMPCRTASNPESTPQPILGSSLCAAQNVTICLDFRSLFRRSRPFQFVGLVRAMQSDGKINIWHGTTFASEAPPWSLYAWAQRSILYKH